VKGRRLDSLGDFNSLDEIFQWLSDHLGIANAFENLSPTKNSQAPPDALAMWVSKQCSPGKEKPLIGISYAFLQGLGLRPLKDMVLQVFIAK
jgi:hypothetical protein